MNYFHINIENREKAMPLIFKPLGLEVLLVFFFFPFFFFLSFNFFCGFFFVLFCFVFPFSFFPIILFWFFEAGV